MPPSPHPAWWHPRSGLWDCFGLIRRISMKMGKALGVLIGILLLATGFAVAAGGDAQTILQKVADTYANLKSYHFEGVTVAETKASTTDSKSATEFSIAMSPPNKL